MGNKPPNGWALGRPRSNNALTNNSATGKPSLQRWESWGRHQNQNQKRSIRLTGLVLYCIVKNISSMTYAYNMKWYFLSHHDRAALSGVPHPFRSMSRAWSPKHPRPEQGPQCFRWPIDFFWHQLSCWIQNTQRKGSAKYTANITHMNNVNIKSKWNRIY